MEEVPASVVSVPEDITELTEFPHLTNTTLVSLFYFNFFEKTFAAKLRSFRLIENTEYRLTIDQLQKSKTEQTTENSRDSDRTFSWYSSDAKIYIWCENSSTYYYHFSNT